MEINIKNNYISKFKKMKKWVINSISVGNKINSQGC